MSNNKTVESLITYREDIPQRADLGKIRRYNHPDNKKYLYGQQNGDCVGCNQHFKARHLVIDHKIPQIQGGQDNIENLQLLCGNCNSIKGDRPMEYLMERRRQYITGRYAAKK